MINVKVMWANNFYLKRRMVINRTNHLVSLLHCTFTTEYYKKGRLNEQKIRSWVDPICLGVILQSFAL